MTTNTHSPTSLAPRLTRLLAMATGSFLFVGAGVSALVAPGSASDVVFGATAIAFFEYGLFVFVRAIVRPRPLLVVSDAGLTINSWRTAKPGRFFTWESIATLRSFRMRATPVGRGQLCIGLVPVDEADPAFTSIKQRVDRAISGVAVSFPLSMLPITLDEFEHLVQTYRADLRIETGKAVRIYGATAAGMILGR